MKIKLLQLTPLHLVMVVTTQLTSCALVGQTTGKTIVRVLTTQGTLVAIECITDVDDCFGKGANAAEGDSGQSLAQFIEDYYSLINQGEYDVAWTYLSPNFKDRQQARGGYTAYTDWWNTIDAVAVKKVEVIEGIDGQVNIDATLKYFKKTDESFSHVLRLSFIWDVENDRWAIENSEVIRKL